MKLFKTFFIFLLLSFTALSYSDEIDDMFKEISSELNRTIAGMNIDPITTLKNTSYINFGERILTYNYTLKKDVEIDWKVVQNSATSMYCSNPDTKIVLDYVNVQMSYYSKTGVFLNQFKFSKSDC